MQRCHAAPGKTSSIARVGRHAEDAGGAALPQGAQKRQPPGVGLGVDRVQAEQAPVAVGARADRRDERA